MKWLLWSTRLTQIRWKDWCWKSCEGLILTFQNHIVKIWNLWLQICLLKNPAKDHRLELYWRKTSWVKESHSFYLTLLPNMNFLKQSQRMYLIQLKILKNLKLKNWRKLMNLKFETLAHSLSKLRRIN